MVRVNDLLTLYDYSSSRKRLYSGAGKRPARTYMAIDREAVIARAKADRRRYRRVDLDLPGRIFMPDEQREEVCKIFDLSAGGARIGCDFDLPAGTSVILYIDSFGRFEGTIVRLTGGDFGVQFNCPVLKRERIAEQLTIFLNKQYVDETALRRHDRKPTRGLARFTRANGEVVQCEVLDLSLSGVSLQTAARPPLGEVVLIGQMAGRVARHHASGVAVEFITPMPTTAGNSNDHQSQPNMAAIR